MPTPLQTLEAISTSMKCGNCLDYLVNGLTTAGAERMDILLALMLSGLAVGSGAWIGIEIVRFAIRLAKGTAARTARTAPAGASKRATEKALAAASD